MHSYAVACAYTYLLTRQELLNDFKAKQQAGAIGSAVTGPRKEGSRLETTILEVLGEADALLEARGVVDMSRKETKNHVLEDVEEELLRTDSAVDRFTIDKVLVETDSLLREAEVRESVNNC